jgi:hypothetical protein
VFDTIPFLAEGERKSASIIGITDKNRVAVTMSFAFLSYLRLLKHLKPSDMTQIVFRKLMASYDTKHGRSFEQDFKLGYNVITERTQMYPEGQRRLSRVK